jgi:hypothetical protein
MNVEIGTEAVQLPENECINLIFLAVYILRSRAIAAVPARFMSIGTWSRAILCSRVSSHGLLLRSRAILCSRVSSHGLLLRSRAILCYPVPSHGLLLRSRAYLCYPVSSCLLKSESWLRASCPNCNYSMENLLGGDQCKCRDVHI